MSIFAVSIDRMGLFDLCVIKNLQNVGTFASVPYNSMKKRDN